MAVYNACVVSTLLYGSEAWTTYSKQERKLNSFHLQSLRRILGISWRDKVPNTEVLDRAGLPTMYTLLRQCRMRWIGHVHRRIPKDILYGELVVGKRPRGRPQLRYKDVCKRDLKALEIDPESWEDIAADRSSWRCLLHKQLKEGEEKITDEAIEKRTRRKEKTTTDPAASTHFCFLMRQGLPFPHWPYKPWAALFRAKHYELTVIGHSFHGRLRPKEAYYYVPSHLSRLPYTFRGVLRPSDAGRPV